MNNTKEKLNYIDVTNKWLKNAKPNSHKVRDLHYYKYKGKKYYVDGKNVVLDYSEKEKQVAHWLKETFGGPIYMCPRVNNPEGIKTPDYIFNSVKLDLKNINGKGKRTLDTSIKKCEQQSNNYIFDITETKLTTKDAIKQIHKLYNTAGRQWINIIILKKHDKLIAVYKKRS